METIKDMWNVMQQGITKAELARKLSANASTLTQKILDPLGFTYENKSWYFKGNPKCMDLEIMPLLAHKGVPDLSDFIGNDSDVYSELPSTPEVHASEENTAELTQKEIAELRELLKTVKAGRLHLGEPNDLRTRIKQMNRSEIARKNIKMTKEAGEALDRFCFEEKLDKQDVVSLAILDFIERYRES
jgi:hypothetical protein